MAVFVASTAIAHHIGAHRTVGHVGGDVHHPWHLLECVEILGEGFPLPVDAVGQGCTGDVLDTLHELDQPVVFVRSSGREPDAAVAEHGRGHPMPRRR